MIIVSGTPGTGKTTLAKEIAKSLKLEYVDVNKLIRDKGLSDGFDKKRDCEIIDTDRLVRELLKCTGVIDSHLAHNIPPKKAQLCIITRCNLRELRRRLEARGYSKEKVRENLDAEIFDVCGTEARQLGHKVIEVWTDKEIDFAFLESFK